MRTIRWTVLFLIAGCIAVTNASDTSTSPASATLTAFAGSISGRVTSSTNGLGLSGTVQFYDLNSDGVAGTATLDGTGNYTINLPAGSYAVLTQNTQGHINEIWNNISCSAVCDVSSINSVDITTNAVTGIDFVLSPGGLVSGTVTSTSTGLPLAGVTVQLIDSGRNVQFTKGVTNIDGIFTTEGGTVAGNVYAVTLNQISYQNEVYDNIKCDDCDPADVGATLIAVAGSGTTGGINFALDPGGAISGTVTDANGVPLAHVFVEAVDSSFHNFGSETDAAGHFTTGGMPAGTYYVHTFNGLGYADKAYNNVLCPDGFCNLGQVGTPVSVVVGSVVQNINFSLPAGGRFSGALTNAAGGAPVPADTGNAGVFVFNSIGVFVMQMNTENDGTYETPDLPPGTYYAQTQNVPGFGNQLYNTIGCSGCQVLTGTPITITVGNTTTNINFPLAAAGSISGTLTNAVGGAVITGANVQVFSSTGTGVGNANTNGSGVYTIGGLAPGSYYVRTNQGGSFINEIYNDIPCQQCAVANVGATLVPVTAGAATTIDFALATGGRISGFVTNASGGAAIQSVAVQLFNSQSVSMGQVNTQANGSYSTAGLPAGTYYVRTTNTLGFINEVYNDIQCPIAVCQAADGTPITVTPPNTTSNINFALNATGGKITGQVTTAGGAPLQNVTVQVYNDLGRFMGGPVTDASGNYSTQSLPDGTYYLRTQNGLGFIEQVYDGEDCLAFCLPLTGTPVNVVGGTATTGKNFALSPGGSISGTIRDGFTLVVLPNVNVAIYTSAGLFVRGAATLSSGSYLATGLPAGTYFLRTVNNSGYQDRIYANLPFCGATCLVTDGLGVPVTVGNTTANANFFLAPAVEKTLNGNFSNGLTSWSIFSQPNNVNEVVSRFVNGAFQYYRQSGTAGVVLQHTGASFASGEGILAQFDLINTSDARKRISVLVHEGDFSDLSVCTFWIPPNSPNRRYAMLTHTTKPWVDATISFYAATAGSNGGYYQLDNVTLQPSPAATEDTECLDPFRPGLLTGLDGPEMLTNGDFSTGSVDPAWGHPFDIDVHVTNGVAEFIRPTGGSGIAGVLQQNTGVPVAAGETVTATFELGNSSTQIKRVTVLLLDPGFTDLSACTFWLPAGQPLSPYTMRAYATQPWGQAAIAFFIATTGNQGWIRLDNVSMKKTPSAHIAGTDCNEPVIGPIAPPEGGAFAFSASSSASLAAAAGASSAGTSTDASGGADFSMTSDANGAVPLALKALDLRHSPLSSLSFQSRRGAAVSTAEIQVSLDGQTWQTLADVPASDDWVAVDVDLSAFAGQVVYLRFVMDAEVTNGRPSSARWQIRRFAIY